mmetsp:Transcript_8471/g.37773  ORF Transcript_8471/g.37773 Transcript_8471/m.37773 type:complete len:87 (+) Transcript_8471:478-738(+)
MVSTEQPERKRARRLSKLAANSSDDAYEQEPEAEAVGSDPEYAVGDDDILPMPKQAMVCPNLQHPGVCLKVAFGLIVGGFNPLRYL